MASVLVVIACNKVDLCIFCAFTLIYVYPFRHDVTSIMSQHSVLDFFLLWLNPHSLRFTCLPRLRIHACMEVFIHLAQEVASKHIASFLLMYTERPNAQDVAVAIILVCFMKIMQTCARVSEVYANLGASCTVKRVQLFPSPRLWHSF